MITVGYLAAFSDIIHIPFEEAIHVTVSEYLHPLDEASNGSVLDHPYPCLIYLLPIR